MLICAAILVGMVLVFTAICATLDWRIRKIPNWLTVPVFALGILLHTIAGGFSGLQFSLLGFATGFGLLLVLWLFGGGGGGDVKMMGALGAWLGSWHTVEVFLASAVATVFLVAAAVVGRAVVQWIVGKRKDPAERKAAKAYAAQSRKEDPKRIGRLMPYAVPVAVGTWVLVLSLAWRDVVLNLFPYLPY
jgi:prepilin peptidase CpaA